MTGRLRQKGNLHLARCGIGFVVFAQIPEAIVKRKHPRRVHADLISKALRLQNSGEPNSVSQIAIEPLLLRAAVFRINFKAPKAIEWNWISSLRGMRGGNTYGDQGQNGPSH